MYKSNMYNCAFPPFHLSVFQCSTKETRQFLGNCWQKSSFQLKNWKVFLVSCVVGPFSRFDLLFHCCLSVAVSVLITFEWQFCDSRWQREHERRGGWTACTGVCGGCERVFEAGRVRPGRRGFGSLLIPCRGVGECAEKGVQGIQGIRLCQSVCQLFVYYTHFLLQGIQLLQSALLALCRL